MIAVDPIRRDTRGGVDDQTHAFCAFGMGLLGRGTDWTARGMRRGRLRGGFPHAGGSEDSARFRRPGRRVHRQCRTPAPVVVDWPFLTSRSTKSSVECGRIMVEVLERDCGDTAG